VIVDFELLSNGVASFRAFKYGSVIDVFVKFRFIDGSGPVTFGFNIYSDANVKLFGSNSHLNPERFVLHEAGGETCCRFRFANVLAGGHYFIDVGVSVHDGDRYRPLQTRRRMIHFSVEPTPWCSGIADLSLPAAR